MQFQSPDYNAGYLLQNIADQIQPGRQVVNYNDVAVLKLPIEIDFFWRFGERRQFWEIENVNALFPSPYHPFGLRWHKLSKDRQHVNTERMNWRNHTANMCMFSELSQPVFGVASNMLSSYSSLNATDLTLLPSMPEGLFMVLAFQNPSSTVELLINRNKMLCLGIRINSQHIHCKDIEKYITANRMKSINKLRENIGTLITSSLSSSLLPLNSCVPALLRIAINRGKVSTKTASVSEPDIESKENLVWEMITPNPLLLDDKMAKTLYYPEFRCSLLNTEPYSMEAVQQRNTDTFSTTATHSFEYRQTIASKFLIKEEEEERINNPKPCFHEATSTNSKIRQCGIARQKHKPVLNIESKIASKSIPKLEQEVVRYLLRNNMMEFFSELIVQKRIKFLCKTYELKLDLTFFNNRKHLFELKEVGEEDSEDGEQDFLIILHPNFWDFNDGTESPLLTESVKLLQKTRKSIVTRGRVTENGNQSNDQQTNVVKVDIASEICNTQPAEGEKKSSKTSTISVTSGGNDSLNVTSVTSMVEMEDRKVDTSQFLSESLHQDSEVSELDTSESANTDAKQNNGTYKQNSTGNSKQKENYTSNQEIQSSCKEVGKASHDTAYKTPQNTSQVRVESFSEVDAVCKARVERSCKESVQIETPTKTNTTSASYLNISLKQKSETSTTSGNSMSISTEVISETLNQNGKTNSSKQQTTMVQAPMKLETAQAYQTVDKTSEKLETVETDFAHKKAETSTSTAKQKEGSYQMQAPLTFSKKETSISQKESGNFKQALSSSPEVSTQGVKDCKQTETLKQKKDNTAGTSIGEKSKEKTVQASFEIKKQNTVAEACKQSMDEPSRISIKRQKEEPSHQVQAPFHSKTLDQEKSEVVTLVKSDFPDSCVRQKTLEVCKQTGAISQDTTAGKQGVTTSLPAQPPRPHVDGNVKQKGENLNQEPFTQVKSTYPDTCMRVRMTEDTKDKACRQVQAPSESKAINKEIETVNDTHKQTEGIVQEKDELFQPNIRKQKEEPSHQVRAPFHSKSLDQEKSEAVTLVKANFPDSCVRLRKTDISKGAGASCQSTTAGETGNQGVTASLPAQPPRPHVGGNVKQKSETSLKPGTANHLKEYLVNAISSSGGDVRLSSLRKCYLQYCSEYQRVHNFTYLGKGFLKVYPQTFDLYVNKSDGINYVRLVASKHKTAS